MMVRSDISNEMIVDLYFNKQYSCNKVAKILKCDRQVVKNRLNNVGLSLRNLSMSEHVYNGMKRNVPISDRFMSVLHGELLGDGCITIRRTNCMGFFNEEVGIYKKEWLNYLRNIFIKNSIPVSNVMKRKDKGWFFYSKGTEEFGNLFKKWYVYNKNYDKNSRKFINRKYIKKIPLDVKINSSSLLHWYIGDGKYNKTGSIYLCTNGFNRASIEYLRYLLKNTYQLETKYYNGMIAFTRYEAEKMIEIIGPCPVKCYQYKWHINCKRKSNINSNIDMKMVEEHIQSGGLDGI